MRFQTIFEFCLQSKINLQVKLKFLVLALAGNANSSLNNSVHLDQSSQCHQGLVPCLPVWNGPNTYGMQMLMRRKEMVRMQMNMMLTTLTTKFSEWCQQSAGDQDSRIMWLERFWTRWKDFEVWTSEPWLFMLAIFTLIGGHMPENHSGCWPSSHSKDIQWGISRLDSRQRLIYYINVYSRVEIPYAPHHYVIYTACSLNCLNYFFFISNLWDAVSGRDTSRYNRELLERKKRKLDFHFLCKKKSV